MLILILEQYKDFKNDDAAQDLVNEDKKYLYI